MAYTQSLTYFVFRQTTNPFFVVFSLHITKCESPYPSKFLLGTPKPIVITGMPLNGWWNGIVTSYSPGALVRSAYWPNCSFLYPISLYNGVFGVEKRYCMRCGGYAIIPVWENQRAKGGLPSISEGLPSRRKKGGRCQCMLHIRIWSSFVSSLSPLLVWSIRFSGEENSRHYFR